MKVAEVNYNRYRPLRAGVIPVVKIEGLGRYYCFGVDSTYGTLTDFGGTISRKDTNALLGALREFREESLGVFEPIQMKDLQQSEVLRGERTLIILYESETINTLEVLFHFTEELKRRLLRQEKPEVSNIVWFSELELEQLLYGSDPVKPVSLNILDTSSAYTLYDRVRGLMRASGRWGRTGSERTQLLTPQAELLYEDFQFCAYASDTSQEENLVGILNKLLCSNAG